MSHNQPWNVAGFNPQNTGGVQMFDPSQFHTTVAATLGDHGGTAPAQKMLNPGQFQAQASATSIPNSMEMSRQNHFPPATSSGSSAFTSQDRGSLGWATGNLNPQQGQNFVDSHFQGQNFFNPGDLQHWNPQQQQQGQWDVSGQNHPQQQSQPQQDHHSQWSQASDPVWAEPEPWLNETSSWGGTQRQAASDSQVPQANAQVPNQYGGEYYNSSDVYSHPEQAYHADSGSGQVQRCVGQVTDSFSQAQFTNSSVSNDQVQAPHQQGGETMVYNTVSITTDKHQVSVSSVGGSSRAFAESADLNDSGTVSSFFGSGDMYEAGSLEPGAGNLALNPPANPALLRIPSLNRTASEISNSSLVTYHNSSLESLDGTDVQQDVGDLADKFQAASMQDSPGSVSTKTDVKPSAQPLQHEISPKTPQSQVISDTHSLSSSHHSGDSLGASMNQGSFGGHSHHSSLDSSDLGLGSGFSSGPGTPAGPTLDLSTGQQPHQQDHAPSSLPTEPSKGSVVTQSNQHGHLYSAHESSSSVLHSHAQAHACASQADSGPVSHPPMYGSSAFGGHNIHGHPGASTTSSLSSGTWSTSSVKNVLDLSHHGGAHPNPGSIAHPEHHISTGGHLESNPVLDTSTDSSLNTSSDTVVGRPTSAFKPVRSPSTSRQNSGASNPDEALFLKGINSKKPPRPPSEGREFIHNQPHRPHSRQKHRTDNNISPATTLWAPPESSFHAPVILAPAAPSPLSSPTHKAKPSVTNSESSTSHATGSASYADINPKAEESRGRDANVSAPAADVKGTDIKETPRREDLYGKKSTEEYDDKPRRRGRHKRQTSRDAVPVTETKQERPSSRADSLKDEYNDYVDGYYRDHYGYRQDRRRDNRRGYDEEYDRPRSRQDEEKRPRSRAGYDRPRSRTDYDRPRSRTDYDRPRSRTDNDRPRSRMDYDQYNYDREYRSRYKGYDYDPYYRQHAYYYDRDYYDYQNRYAIGYYDEYYRHAYDERYQPGYYQESLATYEDTDHLSQTSGASRGNTPADELDQQSVRDPHSYGSRPHSRQHQYSHYDAHTYAGYDNMGYGYGYQGYHYPGYGEYEAKSEAVAKFSLPHVGVRFGPGGQLITIQPNRPAEGQPAMVQIDDLQTLLRDDEEAEEIEKFPGPLIKGETHKNDVLMFCQRQAKMCKEDVDMIDRDSAELLWKFLEMLIKQNGTVVGTDIADLLLEGHEPTTMEYKSTGVKISTSQSQSLENLAEVGEDETEKTLTVVADRSLVNRRKSLTMEEVTDRFRHLLLYGRKKDSLDWAMKNNLWGHALFLASKMDNRTHANVMIRFANSSMRMNDPLQTLYQLMSGRQPAAVTCISDERWGDWRPHLAMVLSNQTPKPDVDRKSILTLGDTLASRGYLYASHFCYLMAQIDFGTYSKKTSKLVLIGSSHNLPFDEFATNEAIQCTEVYEYALSLGNPLSVLAPFQPYKFLYACRMAEFGFTHAALHYCEVIASTVNQAPGVYPLPFVKQLCDLSCRLKYYDPQRQEMGYDLEDPYWLQQLQRSCHGLEDGSIQPISGTATPLGYGTTTGSSESGEIAGLTMAGDPRYMQYQGVAEEDSAYQAGYTAEQWAQQQQQQQVTQEGGEVTGQGDQLPYSTYSGETTQQQMDPNYSNQTYDPNQYNQGYNYGYQQPDGAYGYSGQTGYDAGVEKRYFQDSSAPSDSGFVGDPTTYGARRYSVSGVPATQMADDVDGNLAASSNSDYWGASSNTTNKVHGGPVRQRTVSGGSSLSSGRPRTLSGSSSHSIKASPYSNKSVQPIQAMNAAGQHKKAHNNNNAGGGILSFLASKLTFSTPKNEMKLPKDENPSIIWDPVKNRWVNTDGGEEEQETPAAPPPTDSQLTGPAGSGAGSMGPPGGNRFQKPTARGARSRYVDVLNPGSSSSASAGASVPTSLFSVLPTSTSTAQNIFVPGAVPSSDASSATNPGGSEATPAPVLSVPSDTSTGNEHSRSSSLSSLSREVQQFTQQAIAQAEQDAQQAAASTPSGVPVMFNPSQFSQQNFNQSASSSGSSRPRYGQRRQYPK
ncbi:LOW QUALITY PROTEIN: protein transport protein Sec16A-like [Liolophura sinensis]|uniref:LOW QUALITY PROTEIN: protein transport protein Sec16A-like n=1 Tax=Liolophura sinensis TaxID=3198878 RepID=UPI003158961E